ncbi:UPF0280 family protein [Paramagnetospirillum magneticum]|uniref:Uncharacterized conserved protein n=1 Tax=Paramagnetospirillum magneticum (strain ATCC 700264 / AMB-1) TaxID=342108 RepID=Q2W790_PARM1|nr:UPF0280 family protein [Paramagnetospirillum magneticum]BAE50285.1 Uncharacterized conserved protein [Paramagnetospirillum magneticum AMB-1]
MTPPVAALLPDGKRLHLQHGPIDLIVEAFGGEVEVAAAYAQAAAAFPALLPRLVEELPTLRSAATPSMALFGPVARRMLAAVRPHCATFITPMAAVAGSVADEILAAMVKDRRLERAYVNNGGDIALHLTPGSHFTVGMVSDQDHPSLDGRMTVTADLPVRGIATSGRGGRSFSLGIADSVTVLARDAAAADAAATLIANAVDVEHPAIRRQPARDLAPDSDLGERLVTVSVSPLPPALAGVALDAGTAVAKAMIDRGLIHAACLCLQGQTRFAGSGELSQDLKIAIGQ